MEKRKWYYHPAQVRFHDERMMKDEWCGGIAYHDFIICGCCGSITKLEDEDVQILEELPWINVSREIIGE